MVGPAERERERKKKITEVSVSQMITKHDMFNDKLAEKKRKVMT